MRDELLLEANGPVIKEIKLFSLNFSEDTLRNIISIMKEVRFTPGDIIFTKYELSNSLYILRRGEVELFMERSHSFNEPTVLKKLKPGEIFGELSFFTNNERMTSARSTDFTNVFMIKQEDFLNILQKNPKDFQRYCEIRDNIQIYEDYEEFYIKCPSCKSSSHELKSCPLLHYIPKSDIMILRYNFSTPQDRGWIKRKKEKKYCCLRNLEHIEKGAYKLQEEIFPRHETSSEETDEDNKADNENDDEDDDDRSLFSEENKKSEEAISIENSQIISNDNYGEEKHEESNSKEHISFKTIKRRKSKKRLFLRKDTTKKSMLSSSTKDKPEVIKYFRDSLFMNPSEFKKKYSVLSDEHKERFEEMLDNMPLMNSIFPFGSTNISNTHATSTKKEDILETDRVKSFEEYFQYNNIENIIQHIELMKLKKFNKKMKKNSFLKAKYQLYLQNNLDINESIPTFLKGSRLYSKRKTTTLKQNLKKNEELMLNQNRASQPIAKRYYFKNSLNLQKLIAQEQFDPEKLKAYYRKKYMKKSLKENILIFCKAISNKIITITKKIIRRKKKNSRKRIKEEKKMEI